MALHIGVLSDPANFHTQKWTKALLTTGVKVSVFSFSDATIEGVNCVQVPASWTWKGRITYASYLFGGRRLRKVLEEHGVDVLNPVNVTPFGVWGRRSGFRPMAMVSMGADIFEFPPSRKQLDIPEERLWASRQAQKPGWFRSLLNRVKWKVFRREVKKALHASAFITGDNLELVHAVRDWFEVSAEKVELNRWGVEPDLFEVGKEKLASIRQKYQIKEGQKVVLSPRGLKPIYQGDIILEAFQKLLEEGEKDTVFIVFSAGYDIPEAVREKAAYLEETYPNFHVEWGMIPREEVYAIWPIVDLFVSAPVYDGYSNALGEGRYIGAIPVVNDIPATRELIEDGVNGWMVHPFTPERLHEVLLLLLQDIQTYRSRVSSLNRAWILENAYLAENIQRFYESCRNLKAQEEL